METYSANLPSLLSPNCFAVIPFAVNIRFIDTVSVFMRVSEYFLASARSAVSFSGGSMAERLFITRSRVFSS
ncbi:MAG: hypothetical protein ACLUAJ_10230 [Ruminococcus bicirculans (ex Wegman et al. 2014)]